MNNVKNEVQRNDRRRYPRYYVPARLTLAVDDERLQESIGIGEPADISLGGMRVRNLPSCESLRVGDTLGLLLLDAEEALSLKGEVVHHGTAETFGVEFQRLNSDDQRAVESLIIRLHSRIVQ